LLTLFPLLPNIHHGARHDCNGLVEPASGRVTGTVTQALRFLRKQQVDESVIEKLRVRLTREDKEQLVRDIPLVPEWIEKVFRQLAQVNL